MAGCGDERGSPVVKTTSDENLVTNVTMDDQNGSCHVMESNLDAQNRPTDVQTNNNSSTWSNGQCVLAVPSYSLLNPSFDLHLCRSLLERDGFQVPVQDFEDPLKIALGVPSVRRYMVFNSAFFHFIMAPMLYVVIWCAVFSTLHIYLTVTDYWVLCLSVSLVSIFITTALIFILHHSNKEITVNLDVRLIQVNERMSKHKLLVSVADWVQNCTGTLQLFCVYWDMARCLRTLTEILEVRGFSGTEIQNKLKKRMSHLVLVTEVVTSDPGVEDPGADDEERPLLPESETGRSTSSSQREDSKITISHNLTPDTTLTAQAKAHQLLMTYSAAYVKLLVSERLSGPSHHHLRPGRNHCTTASLCLCQYIRTKILR